MSDSVRVGVIWGSLRVESYNKKLALLVASQIERAHNVKIDLIDLRELDLPMFSEDLEAGGYPESVLDLKKRMIDSDALLYASPEYNGSLSGAMKNAIDWASRPRAGEEVLQCFKGKVVGLLAASPGGLGGLRGLRHLRQILTQVGSFVVPTEFALANAGDAYDEDGWLKDEKSAHMAQGVGDEMVRIAKKLKE